jgi:hypothetical protein
MSPLHGRLGPSASPAASIALVAAAYVATLLALDPRGFWTVDNAAKFLQVQAVASAGWRDSALPWPGLALDPELRFAPLPPPFGRVVDGRLHAFYPPLFALLSSLPWRLAGPTGLHLIPLLAGVATLVGVARLAGAVGLGMAARHAAVLLAGLCTPLWFYAVVFWEHAPAVCLAVFALGSLLRFLAHGARRDLVLASLLATLAVYFRDELYLLCAVLAAVAVWLGPRPRPATAGVALATMALAILPLWAFQAAVLGSPFGLHLGSQLAPDLAGHLRARPLVAYLLFLAALPGVSASLVASAPFAVGLLVCPRLGPRAFGAAIPALAAVAIACFAAWLAGYRGSESPLRWLNASNGLFAGVPFLLLGLVRARPAGDALGEAERIRALWITTAAYALLYALAAPAAGSAGIHWGNRLLLVLYPLLSVLAAANVARWLSRFGRRRPAGALLVLLVLLCSLGAQGLSLHLLRERKALSVRISQEARRHAELPIVTGLWWAPLELHAVFARTPIFLVESSAELRELEGRLRRAGHEHYLFVAAPEHGSELPVARVVDAAFGFFSMDFVRRDLRAGSAGAQRRFGR